MKWNMVEKIRLFKIKFFKNIKISSYLCIFLKIFINIIDILKHIKPPITALIVGSNGNNFAISFHINKAINNPPNAYIYSKTCKDIFLYII